MQEISRLTLAHYDRRADDFWRGTREHDVRQNVQALLGAIAAGFPDRPPPFAILDFGCGPGRDLKAFTALGHVAVGLDCAVSCAELGAAPRARRAAPGALKPGGVLFSSNPRGANEEGWNQGRYGVYHDLEAWRRYLTAAGFSELGHYYRPEGLPRAQQPWLASVWRRR
jgi:hypothetical protein